MLEPSPSRRPSVLLLAGGVREEWTRALEAGGLDVATTGWLDGITAARLRRPDLLLVSTDLPEGAPQSVLTAFRSDDLRQLPIVLAGPGADRMDQEVPGPVRPDQCLPGTIDAGVLPERLRAAMGAGRVRAIPKPAARVAIGLVMVSLLAWGGRVVLDTFAYRWTGAVPSPATRWLLLGAFVVPFVAAVAITFKARTRPISLAERRTLLGWLGLMLWNGGRMFPLGATAPEGGTAAQFAGFSLGLCAFAAWAWLGPSAKQRTPRVRRAFHLLAAGLVLLAASPWALLPWLR